MRASVEFEWDSVKAEANLGKHGISFEATEDPDNLPMTDEELARLKPARSLKRARTAQA